MGDPNTINIADVVMVLLFIVGSFIKFQLTSQIKRFFNDVKRIYMITT